MKAEPTPLDREAARLFTPAQGMRVRVDERPGREVWATVCDDDTIFLEWTRYSSAEGNLRSLGSVAAIDTDDPATVGCMLAQVREADGGPMGYIRPHRDNPWSNETPEFAYSQSDGMARHFGVTLGAAMVAAMRALRGATPPA